MNTEVLKGPDPAPQPAQGHALVQEADAHGLLPQVVGNGDRVPMFAQRGPKVSFVH